MEAEQGTVGSTTHPDEWSPLLSEESLSSSSNPKPAAVLSVSFAGLAGILLGYDVGMVAGVLDPIRTHFILDNVRIELFVGSLNLMALFGCFAASPFADRYGRRGSLSMAAALFFAGNTLQACAWSYAWLLAGRCAAGVAVGITLVLAPLYTAEISPARFRGMLTTLIEVAFNLGIVLGFFATWLLMDVPQSSSWRLIMGLGSMPSLVLLLGAWCVMLESPRWLASQGRTAEAREVLGQVVSEAEGRHALEELLLLSHRKGSGKKAGEEEEAPGWWEMLTLPKLRKVVLVGSMVAFFTQATGIEAIMYYSSTILRAGGYDREATLSATLVIGVFKLAFILVSASMVDGAGRRPLLILSSIGVTMAMAMLTVASLKVWVVLQVLGMVVFVVCFSVGFGPIVYVFNGEIYPQACRSKGMSLSMGVARVTSAVVSLTFLTLADHLTLAGAFALFTGIGIASVVFLVTCVPETKGTTLESANKALQ